MKPKQFIMGLAVVAAIIATTPGMILFSVAVVATWWAISWLNGHLLGTAWILPIVLALYILTSFLFSFFTKRMSEK